MEHSRCQLLLKRTHDIQLNTILSKSQVTCSHRPRSGWNSEGDAWRAPNVGPAVIYTHACNQNSNKLNVFVCGLRSEIVIIINSLIYSLLFARAFVIILLQNKVTRKDMTECPLKERANN